jgi:signal peptidase I
VIDGQDKRDPWSVETGTGQSGRRSGKHAGGAKPWPGRGDSERPVSAGLNPVGRHSARGINAASTQATEGTQDTGPPPISEPERPRQARTSKTFWRELVTIVVAAAVLTLLVKAFLVQVYRIPSASMENTLMVGDRVLVNKLVYHFRDIDRGDIVVFSGQGSWGPDAPPPSSDPVVRVFDDVLSGLGLHSDQTFYIKRVIGLPGDHIACCNAQDQVTVNGIPLNETSYVAPGGIQAQSYDPFHVTVPAGHVWVEGDNRGDSSDSRLHTSDPGGGAIPENEIVGRAFFKIWPPSQFGDLPIPADFQQAALNLDPAAAATLQVAHAGSLALGAVATAPVAGTAGAAGLISTPLLLLRQRRRSHNSSGASPSAELAGSSALPSGEWDVSGQCADE